MGKLDHDYQRHRIPVAMAVIRAKWISQVHPRDLLLKLGETTFELWIANLFASIAHEVEMTKKSYDGEVDVKVTTAASGQLQTISFWPWSPGGCAMIDG